MENLKILIGTLYCGENEFDECLASLKRQTFQGWDHFTLRYLPNKEAHVRLYRTFMENAKAYDYFLKLDADMVFSRDDALHQIINIFLENPDIDHIEMAVHDVPSNSLIWGVHAFTQRVRWPISDEMLFVDPPPEVPGKHVRIAREPAPLVTHCQNPTAFQAYMFGVHRALKVVQHGKTLADFNFINALEEWKLLKRIWHNFQRCQTPMIGFSILGAEQVMNGQLHQEDYNYKGRSVHQYFETHFSNLTAAELRSQLAPHWRLFQRELRFLRLNGLKILVSMLLRLPRKLRKTLKAAAIAARSANASAGDR